MENQEGTVTSGRADAAESFNPLYEDAPAAKPEVAQPVAETPPVAVQPEPVPPVAQAVPAAASQAEVKYAGFWIRFVALIIDVLVLIIPNAIVGRIMDAARMVLLGKLITMLLNWAYYVWMTDTYQATLGKRAMGIKVVSDNLERATLNQLVMREIVGKLLSSITLGIGYVMAGFTERKRALHDMIAGTVVIYGSGEEKQS